ncbi:tetratricopeptide repeat protein [Kitasatospora sp. NPDC001527]|uniref:tetratricopeptide repeat protein n=1 Tax=Kitasatospora sp. NPDC001527 TaxID=3154519 RepID=UPI003326D5D7
MPADLDEAHDLYRTLTAGQHTSVLLDDAATAAQVERLIPAGSGPVLVTARWPPPELLATGVHHHRLGPLPADASRELLLSIGSLPRPRIAELAAACQGIPQALLLAGATLLPTPRTNTETVVFTAFTATYNALAPQAARLYRIVGLLPSADLTIDLAMAGAAAGLDPAATADAFSDLAEAQLLFAPVTDSGRWEFVSSGARAHAASLDTEDRTSVIRRALDWLTAETTAASRLAAPYRDPLDAPLVFPPPHRADHHPDQALDFLRTRGPHLDAALTTAEAHHPAIVPHLVFAAWPHYLRTRHYREWLDHHDRALTALGTPASDVERRLYRELLGARATVLRALNRVPEALTDCHRALATARETNDRPGIAQHDHDLGAAYRRAGAHTLARQHFDRARRLSIDLGRHRGAALAHLELALTDADLGEDATTVTDRLSVAERGLLATGDPLNSHKARAWRGRILATDGRVTDARPVLTSALEGFREQNARLWEARTLSWIADVDRQCGRTGDAITLLRHAATLYEHHSPADHAHVTGALRDLRSRT